MRKTAKKSVPIEAKRVRVAIRCRPAFKTEIDDCAGKFVSVVNTINDESGIGRVFLRNTIQGASRFREFAFDYVFGPDHDQGAVFEAVAEPIISDFLHGKNGTLFAYGQTGTGKTYTMGVLEFVKNENAGIIPRTISRIFKYADQELALHGSVTKVSLSFLQLYRGTVQDLLAPLSSETANTSQRSIKTTFESNLAIREDPMRGFYVEDLQEFEVSNYSEAELLVNIGLENRAIASTFVNATSSRSHTILSIYVETQKQKGDNRQLDGNLGRRSRRKLMLVDLAGSERVRRSASQGARLAEAKSINSSLSALGNVIAALADLNGVMAVGHSHTHIPYRGSKLTKLLQDSLGGSASTALIATVGPAAGNHGETLSTLQFAHRCMSVKGLQQQHVEGASDVDYMSECVGLREELSSLEIELSRQQQISAAQVRVYDAAIRQLYGELALTKRSTASAKVESPSAVDTGPDNFDFKKLGILIDHLNAAAVCVPLVEKDIHNAAGMQTRNVVVEDTPCHSLHPLASLQECVSRSSHRNYTPKDCSALGTSTAGPSHMNMPGGTVPASHIGMAFPDDVTIRGMEATSMQREDLKKRSTALSSLLPQIGGPASESEAYMCSRPQTKPQRTTQQKTERNSDMEASVPATSYSSSFKVLESHDHCRVYSKETLPQRNHIMISDSRAPSKSAFVTHSSGDQLVSDAREGKEVDGIEACDLVNQIRSLNASQLALLNPAMREQVMAIKRLAESDAWASDSVSTDRDNIIAGTEWSSKSSDRPLYWQHRHHNYSVVECDYLSEGE